MDSAPRPAEPPQACDITANVPWIRIGDLQWVNGDVAVQQWTAAAKAAGLDVEPAPYALAHPDRDLAIVSAHGLLVTVYVDGDQVCARLLGEGDFTEPIEETGL